MTVNADVKATLDSPYRSLANEPFAELLRHIEAEIAQEPRFSVTLPAAQRLWGIDYATTIFLFRHLTERGVLSRTPRGEYIRG
jgi:hypothetical protein